MTLRPATLHNNYYRRGSLRAGALFEDLKPGEPPAGGDFMFKLRVTLGQGRAVKIVRAVGYTDC